VGAEGGFRFVAICNAYEMVGMAEVDFCIDACFSQSVKEVGNERKWVVVLF